MSENGNYFLTILPTGDKDGWMREVKFSNSRHTNRIILCTLSVMKKTALKI